MPELIFIVMKSHGDDNEVINAFTREYTALDYCKKRNKDEDITDSYCYYCVSTELL